MDYINEENITLKKEIKFSESVLKEHEMKIKKEKERNNELKLQLE
jgi:hypothetical protein